MEGGGGHPGSIHKQKQAMQQQKLQKQQEEQLEIEKERKAKKRLYQLIIKQLEDDGFIGAANAVAEATMTAPSAAKLEPQRLAQLVTLAIDTERERSGELVIDEQEDDTEMKGGLDLDSGKPDSAKVTGFVTRFITTHKGSVRVARYSRDGKYVVTGSEDHSLKLLDVNKMHYHHQTKSEVEDYASARPVIRTFYDHTGPVNDIDLHPYRPVVASASKDTTIKFFDYTKASMKRSFRYIQESNNVRTLNFHPSGDFLIVGTDHNVLRLYDVNTFQCFSSSNPQDHHFSPINQVRYSSDGKLFLSGGKDGAIKIWDGVTGRCVNTIPNAHSGAEVCSVQFSRNTKYILSGGKDSTSKLWELSTGRTIRTYTGANGSQKRVQTTFNCDETLVFSSDGPNVVVWDTLTGDQLHRLPGHNRLIRWIGASPTEQSFMTCSDDQRARFWTAAGDEDLDVNNKK